MKKLLAALLVSIFMLSHGVCSDLLTRFATVSISSNGHLWFNVPVDLSTAVYNPQTKQKEIYMTVDVPAGQRVNFVRSPGYLSQNIFFNPIPMPECPGCVILGLMILIIGGIIIYILIRTCEKLLPPTPTNNQ